MASKRFKKTSASEHNREIPKIKDPKIIQRERERFKKHAKAIDLKRTRRRKRMVIEAIEMK